MQRALPLSLAIALTACTKAPVEAPAPAKVTGSEAPSTSRGPSFPGGERPTRIIPGDSPCATDDDCVPAACCHARACVARVSAPSCGDVMCTQSCEGGTIDCGGGCLCHEGHCAARVVDPR